MTGLDEKKPQTPSVPDELTPNQRAEIWRAVKEVSETTLRLTTPKLFEEFLRGQGLSEEIVDMADSLASRSNEPPEEVLRKALNLYSAALDAAQNGNHLAILTPTDDIVQDIVGIGPQEPAAMAMMK